MWKRPLPTDTERTRRGSARAFAPAAVGHKQPLTCTPPCVRGFFIGGRWSVMFLDSRYSLRRAENLTDHRPPTTLRRRIHAHHQPVGAERPQAGPQEDLGDGV